MIFCVNVGNTNTRFAMGTENNYRQAILPTSDICAEENLRRFLEEQFSPDMWENIQGSVISSVVPGAKSIVTETIRRKLNKPPRQIDMSRLNIDFTGYKSQLGEDRIICCAAALAKYAPPVIMVDLGTATTINIVNKDRVFLGGAIFAGVHTGLNALSEDTALLPKIDDLSIASVIGDDTKTNLISGAVIGTAAAVGGYVKRINDILGHTSTVVVTGGNAPFVLPYCDFDFNYESSLLIDGLFYCFYKNKGKAD